MQPTYSSLYIPQEQDSHTPHTLWSELNSGRRVSHKKVISNPFLQKLVTGGFCQTEFAKYLANLLPIHTALEDAQQTLQKIDSLKVFVLPKLFRSEAIQQDLKIWGSLAAETVTASENTQKYAEYIRTTANIDPERILAIMYTFYGTILSGGQMNKKVVESSINTFRGFMNDIPEGSGAALYEVKTKNLAKFKNKWHEKLCQVETLLSPERNIEEFRQKLSHEVTFAFESFLHIIESDVENHHC